uniref:Uncharacterized protein n=1 Tax=Oryza nivara TaxID=4536 RepID=A0A0E0GZB6_ORYNI
MVAERGGSEAQSPSGLPIRLRLPLFGSPAVLLSLPLDPAGGEVVATVWRWPGIGALPSWRRGSAGQSRQHPQRRSVGSGVSHCGSDIRWEVRWWRRFCGGLASTPSPPGGGALRDNVGSIRSDGASAAGSPTADPIFL